MGVKSQVVYKYPITKPELLFYFEQLKFITMDKLEKKRLMEKMMRELEDILNSQTSLLKKISQLEAENINVGNSVLEKRLPDIHGKVDDGIAEIAVVMEEFTAAKNKFVTDNKLDEALPEPGT